MSNAENSIAVIGAGPAGLMAADILAQKGHRAIIYDSMPSPARKFLMAGRGGLNLTHIEPLQRFMTRYRSLHPFLEESVRNFDNLAVRQWADALGAQTFVGSSGRVFPKAMKASPLLRAWLRRLEAQGVALQTHHQLVDITSDGVLTFRTPDGTSVIRPRATILAMGGASWPRLGSTGTWRDILLRIGVQVEAFQPSNMGFLTRWTPYFSERFAGTPLKSVAFVFGGMRIAGEAMVTREGLEGGAIYALSAALRETIRQSGSALLIVDLKPDWPTGRLSEKLQMPRRAKETSTHFLARAAGLAPVAIGLLREATGNSLPQDAEALAALIKAVPISFHAMQGLERAISSAGGISLDALDSDFMLKSMPGVFAAGEMLDWEAPTGGYLLQATFATAVAAARGVCHYLDRKH